MAPYKKRRATYQDVLDAPEHMIAEIIAGELHLSPRPGMPATRIGSSIGQKLGYLFEDGGGGSDAGGWQILWEPELHLGDEIVVPDLAGWRVERLDVVPEDAFLTLPPDWVCEVLSKSTEKIDRTEKMPLYASVGIPHAWLVHPRKRTLEAFRRHEATWLSIGLFKDTDRVRIEPFDAIELDLAALWKRVPLPSRASEEPGHYEHGWY
jgi:Uma2 family endonuclease